MAQVLLDRAAEAVDPPLVDEVFEPRLPAVVAAAVVALREFFWSFFCGVFCVFFFEREGAVSKGRVEEKMKENK